MRITRWVEYGVHILAAITKEQDAGAKAVGASSIAQELGIARDYTLQVLHRLKDGGILTSSRGPRGGYTLARASEEITLKEIMHAAEGNTFEVICETKPLTSDRCLPDSACGLKAVWYDLRDHLHVFLESKSLRELTDSIYVSGQSPLVQLSYDTSFDSSEADDTQAQGCASTSMVSSGVSSQEASDKIPENETTSERA